MAHAPAAARAQPGGSARRRRHGRLWATAGGPSLEITEIDYAEVLREKQGLAATIDSIIEAAMSGPTLTVDDAAMRAVIDIIQDPAKLEQMMQTLEQTASRSPQGVELQTAALLNIVRGLVDYVGRTDPQQLNTIFEQFGRGARHLSVEAMIALLAERKRPEAMAGSVNVVSALIESMSDESVAGFVADSVVAERGASERLAHAFRSLVPEFDRQRQLLALAREEVAASEMAREQDPEEFKGLWNGVEQMLTSYTDARYVSEDYARELSHARTLPVDVERVSDDPPERIAAWLVDGQRRGAAQPRSGSADRPAAHRDRPVALARHRRHGRHARRRPGARRPLRSGVARSSRRSSSRGIPARSGRPHAAAALDRFARGSLMKHVAPYLRSADDESYERFKRICHAIGPSIIAPLAEVLAAEQDARARKHLRDLLVGFGPRGAEAVRPLLNAQSWEVRRTAAFLLREFGGAEGLKELVPLLADSEPLVQREAVQGLMLNGTKEAAVILLNALTAAKGRRANAARRSAEDARPARRAALQLPRPADGSRTVPAALPDGHRGAGIVWRRRRDRGPQGGAAHRPLVDDLRQPEVRRAPPPTRCAESARSARWTPCARRPRTARRAPAAPPAPSCAGARITSCRTDPAARLALYDELLRRFASGTRAAQLYAADHPLLGRNVEGLLAALKALQQQQPSITDRHRRQRVRRRRHAAAQGQQRHEGSDRSAAREQDRADLVRTRRYGGGRSSA